MKKGVENSERDKKQEKQSPVGKRDDEQKKQKATPKKVVDANPPAPQPEPKSLARRAWDLVPSVSVNGIEVVGSATAGYLLETALLSGEPTIAVERALEGVGLYVAGKALNQTVSWMYNGRNSSKPAPQKPAEPSPQAAPKAEGGQDEKQKGDAKNDGKTPADILEFPSKDEERDDKKRDSKKRGSKNGL